MPPIFLDICLEQLLLSGFRAGEVQRKRAGFEDLLATVLLKETIGYEPGLVFQTFYSRAPNLLGEISLR